MGVCNCCGFPRPRNPNFPKKENLAKKTDMGRGVLLLLMLPAPHESKNSKRKPIEDEGDTVKVPAYLLARGFIL